MTRTFLIQGKTSQFSISVGLYKHNEKMMLNTLITHAGDLFMSQEMS